MHSELWNITIRTLDQRQFTIQASSNTSIPDLKQAVARETRIACDSQVVDISILLIYSKTLFILSVLQTKQHLI